MVSISSVILDFDLSCFFQGIQEENFMYPPGVFPIQSGISPPPVFWRDGWDGEGTSILFLIFTWMDTGQCKQELIFFLRDASYLRMKSLQIGIILPEKTINKLYLKNADYSFQVTIY